MWFNQRKPTLTSLRGGIPQISEWPEDDWKYADLQFVYPRTTDLIRKIVDATPLTGEFRRVLIDVKVQDLTPDFYSCIPGWHLDGAFPEVGKMPDYHHLCVLNGPQTEFIDEPLQLVVSREITPALVKRMIKTIPSDAKVAKAKEGFITTFTSLDFHRGVRAEAPTRRLLVRLTETNTIPARNKPQAPSMGARV